MTRETENNLMAEIAENERWLAQFEAPPPSDALLANIKRATRAELKRDRASAAAPIWWQRPWHGAVAAAAMVAICVGVVWYAQTLDIGAGQSSLNGERLALADAEPLSDWKALPTASGFDDEPLDELEDWEIGDSWALSGASMYETFEAALVDDGATGAEATQQGAVAPVVTDQMRSI